MHLPLSAERHGEVAASGVHEATQINHSAAKRIVPREHIVVEELQLQRRRQELAQRGAPLEALVPPGVEILLDDLG